MSTGCIPVGFILNGTYGSTSGKDAPTLAQGEVMLGTFSHTLYKHWRQSSEIIKRQIRCLSRCAKKNLQGTLTQQYNLQTTKWILAIHSVQCNPIQNLASPAFVYSNSSIMSFHNLMARLKQDSNRLTTKFHKCSRNIFSLSNHQSKEP